MAADITEKEFPVLSFILPAYNSENTLTTCVAQLLQIKDLYTEIVLVDDGSNDRTGAICDELASENKNVVCGHQKNQGVSAARNHGLDLAKGEYVQFIDNDDIVDTDLLSKIIQALSAHPEVDMAIFGLSFDYYHNGLLYRRDDIPPALSGIKNASEWINSVPALYQSNSLSPVWNKIIRRSVLINNDLNLRQEMFLYEDLEYSIRAMAHCNAVWFFDDIVYHYRQSEDEGNAGRRLRRVDHLPDLLNQIEPAFKTLYEFHPCETADADQWNILDSLYRVLAREKITVSSKSEIVVVCDDYHAWRQAKGKPTNQIQDKFTKQLCEKQVMSLISERAYVKYRHKLAVAVKSMRAGKKEEDQ